MGLLKCPDCGNMVSERAEKCPSCGCPVSAFKPDFMVLSSALIGYHLLKCMDMLHERRERRRDFTKGVLQTAAGVVLGNKISGKLKKKD